MTRTKHGFEMNAPAVTIGQLRETLKALVDGKELTNETPVVVSQDPEGNGFHWFHGFSVERFDADPKYSDLEYPLDGGSHGVKTMVLWPA